ncbi:MAG: hypothetical protein V4586_17925 [Pseudomonadota bacterium]
MLGAFFFCLIVGAGLVAPWFVLRLSMFATLAVVVLGLAIVAYSFWAQGLAGYDQLKILPLVAVTCASLVALGLRGAFLVMQGQGIQLSTPQKMAALAMAFGVFAALLVLNM